MGNMQGSVKQFVFRYLFPYELTSIIWALDDLHGSYLAGSDSYEVISEFGLGRTGIVCVICLA